MAFAIGRPRRLPGGSAVRGHCTTETMFYLVVFMYVMLSLLVFQLSELSTYSKTMPLVTHKQDYRMRDFSEVLDLRDLRLDETYENSCCNATNSGNQLGSRTQKKVISLTDTGKTGVVAEPIQIISNHSTWQLFTEGVNLDELYPRHASYMSALLEYMNSAKIVNASIFKGGTQIKFLLRFDDGNEAIAKPMRHPRNYYWGYNNTEHFSTDEERHTAEIASFHLDRILDFRKVIPCIGRRVNFTSEIVHNTNDPGILGTMREISGNTCFVGNCVWWFCNEDHPICDHNGVMELSVCARLPGKIYAAPHLWSQGVKEAEIWKNKNVCGEALQDKIKLRGRFFLDTMEVALFDNLIINYDRHHFDRPGLVDPQRSFALINDNGKGFGNPYKDDVTFLAPIYQCCRFRNSTYQQLLSLSGRLGNLMKESLATDPLAPVLTDPFFAALDRRLDLFFEVINKCLKDYGYDVVFLESFV